MWKQFFVASRLLLPAYPRQPKPVGELHVRPIEKPVHGGPWANPNAASRARTGQNRACPLVGGSGENGPHEHNGMVRDGGRFVLHLVPFQLKLSKKGSSA